VGLLHEEKKMGIQSKTRPVIENRPGLALHLLTLLLPGETPKSREQSDWNVGGS
jgi:hypothetical protein